MTLSRRPIIPGLLNEVDRFGTILAVMIYYRVTTPRWDWYMVLLSGRQRDTATTSMTDCDMDIETSFLTFLSKPRCVSEACLPSKRCLTSLWTESRLVYIATLAIRVWKFYMVKILKSARGGVKIPVKGKQRAWKRNLNKHRQVQRVSIQIWIQISIVNWADWLLKWTILILPKHRKHKII